MKAVVTSNLVSFVQSISTIYNLDSGHKMLERAAGDLGVCLLTLITVLPVQRFI